MKFTQMKEVDKEWDRDKDFVNVYYCLKKFEDCFYKIVVFVEENNKTIKYYIGATSGKKKKDLEIFEAKDNKSNGGLKALIWLKNKLLEFPSFYADKIGVDKTKTQYILVRWADNRRRNIYQRLEKEGFYFMIDSNYKYLIKKL